ncbi:MAG: hypothetical protein AMK69_18485 [Nitrospira bacterium SG8_3]|nr:MAG: hypothetical protein AMK69_18485 [Nitrospira bacterium SG8_3]
MMSENRNIGLPSTDERLFSQGHGGFLLGFPYVSLEMFIISFQNEASIIIPKTKYLSIYNNYLNLYILNIKQCSTFSYETTQLSIAILDESKAP